MTLKIVFLLLGIDYFKATTPNLQTALRQQKVDFCLLLTSNIKRDSGLEVETIIRSLRQLWIALGHALLSQSVIYLRDIEKLPFLMLETDRYLTVITNVWQQEGYQPWSLNGQHVILRTIEDSITHMNVGGAPTPDDCCQFQQSG